MTARSHALHILYFVCLDHRVMDDANILNSIQDAMEAITCSFTDNKRLVAGVGSPWPSEEHTLMQLQLNDILAPLVSRVRDAGLQRKLVCALPDRSPLTAYVQRYLALSFLLSPELVDAPLSDPKIPRMIHRLLNTATQFRVDKHTNYGHLADRMILLDIAVGPGLLSVPYQPLVSPAPSQAGSSSPITAPVPDSSEMKEFNKEADALVQHVKMIGNSMVEAGAVVDFSILGQGCYGAAVRTPRARGQSRRQESAQSFRHRRGRAATTTTASLQVLGETQGVLATSTTARHL